VSDNTRAAIAALLLGGALILIREPLLLGGAYAFVRNLDLAQGIALAALLWLCAYLALGLGRPRRRKGRR
jgi:hypothetical protein